MLHSAGGGKLWVRVRRSTLAAEERSMDSLMFVYKFSSFSLQESASGAVGWRIVYVLRVFT